MISISTEAGNLSALKFRASTVGLSMLMVLGFPGGASLAETTTVPVQQSTSTQSSTAVKTASPTITVHKDKAPAESAQATDSKDFWKRLAHNRKVSWMAGDLEVPTDTIETPSDIRVLAEVPGIDEKNLDVTVAKDTVTIQGEKIIDTTQKAEDFRRLERVYGKFEKTIVLPSAVDGDNSVATLKNGILMLTLPKIATTQNEGKKLSIRRE